MAQYRLGARDRSLLAHGQILLKKLLAAPFSTPAEKVSIAKALHVLHQVPLPSVPLDLRILLMAPERTYNGSGEEHRIAHAWQIEIRGQLVELHSSGYFSRPMTGGDSFTALHWTAKPGVPAELDDYLHALGIVDDAMPFEQEMQRLNLTEAGYRLEIEDEENTLLMDYSESEDEDEEDVEVEDEVEDEEEEDDDEVGTTRMLDFGYVPMSQAERRLLSLVDLDEARGRDDVWSGSIGKCDSCSTCLATCAMFVDGMSKRDGVWALFCAECFLKDGAGIRFGLGQLYLQQPEAWIMIAGYPPDA